MSRALACVILGAILGAPPAGQACGYHDPSSVNLGSLNWVYPDSLHVRTAVWMAQHDGVLPPRGADADEADEQVAKLRMVMRLGMTVAKLRALRERLEAAHAQQSTPAFSVILIGPMLWARFDRTEGALALETHADGPGHGNVVVVTDEPVVAALVEETLTPRDALRAGLIRLYGSREGVESVAALLDSLAPAKPQSDSPRFVSKEVH